MAQATPQAAPAPQPVAPPARRRFPNSLAILVLSIPIVVALYLGGRYLLADSSKSAEKSRPFTPLAHPNWKICWKTIRESDVPGNQPKKSDCDEYKIENEEGKTIFVFDKDGTLIKFTVTYNVLGELDYRGSWIWDVNKVSRGRGKFFFRFVATNLAVGWLEDSIGGIHTLELTPI